MKHSWLLLLLTLVACQGGRAWPLPRTAAGPRAVTLQGYAGQAMEPFLSRDGRLLFFNNPNSDRNPDLHYAERVDDTTYAYRGPLDVNTGSLEAVATMDRSGRFFFVSNRDYANTLNTVFSGTFADGRVAQLRPLLELATGRLGRVVFDIEASADGEWLVLAEGDFDFARGPVPLTADLTVAVSDGRSYRRQANSLLTAVNTSALEYASGLSSDGLTLMFTRAQPGRPPQIFVSRRNGPAAPFGKPSLVPGLQNFVEAPTLLADGRSFYYHALVQGRFELFLGSL